MQKAKIFDLIVIGGGAAGFFGAINFKTKHPNKSTIILEKSNKLLSKVKISGGGRCNITHNCFDNSLLVKNYPRGEKEIRSAFSKFSVEQLLNWFKEKGIEIISESDGRMFPKSNSSQTIIDLFLNLAEQFQIPVNCSEEVLEIKKDDDIITVKTNKQILLTKNVLIASGGHPKSDAYNFIKKLGHHIIDPVPSLFTFNLPKNPITELMGTSVKDAEVKITEIKKSFRGPLLITHWGLSGPAVLKLSAFTAVDLFKLNYKYTVQINWLPDLKQNEIIDQILQLKLSQGNKLIKNVNLFNLPNRLWEFMLEECEIITKNCADLSKQNINKLVETISNHTFKANGKTTYKEEFVTSGGVDLKEVNMQTFESKIVPNIFFAGEVLNIDGITGGFNFQNAWSSSYTAVESMR